MIRFAALTSRIQAALYEAQFNCLGAQKLHEFIWVVLVDGIPQQTRLLQRCAFGAYRNIKYVGNDMDRGSRLFR